MRKVAPAIATALLLTLFVAPVGAQGIRLSMELHQDNVRQNQSVWASTLRVEGTEGYSKTVTLKAENVPSGVTISFYPNNRVPYFTSDVTVHVDSGVALGVYNITFKAEGEGVADSVIYRLRVMERYVSPEEQGAEVGIPVYVWVGVAAVVAAVILLAVYLRIRAGKEWAPAPPAPAPPAPAPPAQLAGVPL